MSINSDCVWAASINDVNTQSTSPAVFLLSAGSEHGPLLKFKGSIQDVEVQTGFCKDVIFLLLGQNESPLIHFIFLWPDISKVQPSIVAGLACLLLSLLPGAVQLVRLNSWKMPWAVIAWKSNALGPKPLPSSLMLANLILPWAIQFYICLCRPSHCSV